MTKKSYADICLERAEKASPGPWDESLASEAWLANSINNSKFCRHARTDVPELAKKLNKACRVLRDKYYTDLEREVLAEELEADLEEK